MTGADEKKRIEEIRVLIDGLLPLHGGFADDLRMLIRVIDGLRADGERLDAYERMARNGIKPGVLFYSEDGFQGWEWGNNPYDPRWPQR